MTAAWIEADTVALRRALALVDDAQRGRRGTDSALIALLDRLGLTPAGRLRLRWLVPVQPAQVITFVSDGSATGDPRADR